MQNSGTSNIFGQIVENIYLQIVPILSLGEKSVSLA